MKLSKENLMMHMQQIWNNNLMMRARQKERRCEGAAATQQEVMTSELHLANPPLSNFMI